jgi:hypothetical protein
MVRVRAMRRAYRILSGKLDGIRHVEEQRVDTKKTLKSLKYNAVLLISSLLFRSTFFSTFSSSLCFVTFLFHYVT